MSQATTLILGIGNNLLQDEGVGVHLVQRLQGRLAEHSEVTCLDGGTLSFTLADAVASHPNLIVIDACATGGPPGTVCRFEGAEMDRYLRGGGKSVHEVSLSDLLDMARLTGGLPGHRLLVGVEPECLDWGETLTPAVAAALLEAERMVLETLEQWKHQSESEI